MAANLSQMLPGIFEFKTKNLKPKNWFTERLNKNDNELN